MELYRRIFKIQNSLKLFFFSKKIFSLAFLSIFLSIPGTNISSDIHQLKTSDNNFSKFYKKEDLKQKKLELTNIAKYSSNNYKRELNVTENKFIRNVSKLYVSYFEKKKHIKLNDMMRRIIISFLQFETISRKIFNRETKSLPNQANLKDLADHIVESNWFRNAIKLFSSNNAYGFSEERMLRVLFSIQVASSTFDIPYPSLFCLFFQESKFNFLANSHTGAKGIGQLTSIGIKEINRLRLNPKKELLLQKTAENLNQVYNDQQINLWLEKLGFKISLPIIKPIPKKIEFTKIESDFIKDVGVELVKKGHLYGKNLRLLWYLSKKIRRGKILSQKYAHTHKIFSEMLEKKYANSPSSAYNIETNILASTMLFDHYFRYKWKFKNDIFVIPEDTRLVLASSSYNHGQTGMLRFLRNLKHEFPLLNFEKLNAKKFIELFSVPRLKNAVQRPNYKIRETSIHVEKIMECSSKRAKLLKFYEKKI